MLCALLGVQKLYKTMDPGFWRGGAAASPLPPHSASQGIRPHRPETRAQVENKYDIESRHFSQNL
jgi:hypothetical protein